MIWYLLIVLVLALTVFQTVKIGIALWINSIHAWIKEIYELLHF